jgi:pyruvate kinase
VTRRPPLRRTKIVCTIGPATAAPAELRALIEAGMNVARLNFSHGTHETHGEVIAHLRRLAAELERPVAILQDLAGPKVRIGTFADDAVELECGEAFTLTTRAIEGSRTEVSVSYAGLPGEVKPGDRLLLADGKVELEVIDVGGEDIRCRVVVGGVLSARKGVNCPSGLAGLPILDEQDRRDLAFGVAQGVDYVGLSFVRTADDVQTALREIASHGGDVPVIAKIETGAALENFDAILAVADGIMIARGDLSIETPFARVPIVQKALLAKANRAAKPAITATQMLYSMVEQPKPTRAEVADVANAIVDGSDAVMLSEETTIGKYPVRAVETLVRIATETETALSRDPTLVPPTGDEREAQALAQAACQLAASLDADVVATITTTGSTARYVARHRPRQPILAFTARAGTFRQLALVRGVVPFHVEADEDAPDDVMRAGVLAAEHRGWSGQRVVFVSRETLRWGRI